MFAFSQFRGDHLMMQFSFLLAPPISTEDVDKGSPDVPLVLLSLILDRKTQRPKFVFFVLLKFSFLRLTHNIQNLHRHSFDDVYSSLLSAYPSAPLNFFQGSNQHWFYISMLSDSDLFSFRFVDVFSCMNCASLLFQRIQDSPDLLLLGNRGRST